MSYSVITSRVLVGGCDQQVVELYYDGRVSEQQEALKEPASMGSEARLDVN